MLKEDIALPEQQVESSSPSESISAELLNVIRQQAETLRLQNETIKQQAVQIREQAAQIRETLELVKQSQEAQRKYAEIDSSAIPIHRSHDTLPINPNPGKHK